jgi:SAM-dependent methyltransferase
VRSPFDNPVLYDWEYRRRRDDIRFYRTLAAERGGPVLDVGCGTGRLLIPLVRDGHRVVGVDASAAMLSRAAERLRRMRAEVRTRASLMRTDMRRLPLRSCFAFIVAAFHTVQHCESDQDWAHLLAGVRAALVPGGWFAFDTFAPSPRFLARSGWSGATAFRHPQTGFITHYRERHSVESAGGINILDMTFQYQSLRNQKRPKTDRVRLRHRLLSPDGVQRMLRTAGLALIASWGGFDGTPLDDKSTPTEQHIYLARCNKAPSQRMSIGPE